MANLAIDTGRIEAMLTQLRATATKAQGPQASTDVVRLGAPDAPIKTGFADALKASLDQVNAAQNTSEKLGQAFASGDDKVSLSDAMISMQKANIQFQGAVQVRNKLVSAYHDIMNMQI